MFDSDSDVSWPSGDPNKYWWIGGDHPYSFPPEWGHEEDQPSYIQDDPLPTTDDDTSGDNPRVLELEDLTREMEGRIHELEDDAQRHKTELTRSATFYDQLVERVASLCTYNCTKLVEDAATEARVKRLTQMLWIAIAVIVGLVSLVLALMKM